MFNPADTTRSFIKMFNGIPSAVDKPYIQYRVGEINPLSTLDMY
jgi:hypothetical protein